MIGSKVFVLVKTRSFGFLVVFLKWIFVCFFGMCFINNIYSILNWRFKIVFTTRLCSRN